MIAKRAPAFFVHAVLGRSAEHRSLERKAADVPTVIGGKLQLEQQRAQAIAEVGGAHEG